MSILHITIPTWVSLASDAGIEIPFPFWNVGDQPMLFHWMDLAQECDIEEVILHVPVGIDTVDWEVRYLDRLSLWPVRFSMTHEPPPSDEYGPEFTVVGIETLNLEGTQLQCPGIWELLEHHWKLVSDRLEMLWHKYVRLAPGIPVGRGSSVHRSATLIEPYWIGEGCQVGAGAVVGPYATLDRDCIIGDGAIVSHTHLGSGTRIGPHSIMKGRTIENGVVFNRAKKITHQSLDPLLVSGRTTFGISDQNQIRHQLSSTL
jgi:hypothetical protein